MPLTTERATHTPAPWRADIVGGADAPIGVGGGDGRLVATVITPNDASRLRDAQIIAAAPRLLEACKAAAVTLPESKRTEHTLALLHAAIDQAEGRCR